MSLDGVDFSPDLLLFLDSSFRLAHDDHPERL
jgi:hypothetical protein